jgi:predicted PurR-regulated permease PerM
MRILLADLPAAFTRVTEELQLGSFADMLKGSSSVSSVGNLASRIFSWSSTVLGVLASAALVIFGGIYLAIDPGLYRRGFVKLFPPAIHPNVNATLDDAGEALRRWLRGQLVAMVLVGILAAFGLWVAGVPSAFALGFIIGLAEFVPIIGPILAAVPAILVAGAQDWQTAFWALAVLVVVQQIEGNVITPLVAGQSVAVPPAVALFAVVALGVLFGPLGLLFGFPLAVVIDVAVRRLYVLDTLGERVEIMGEAAADSRHERPNPAPQPGSPSGRRP